MQNKNLVRKSLLKQYFSKRPVLKNELQLKQYKLQLKQYELQ